MNSLLLISIIVILISGFLLLKYFWRQWKMMGRGLSHAHARIIELEEEHKEKDYYLGAILQVLNGHVGGISKRIHESAEIAEAIQSHGPDLFKKCPGLAYWLHANDQFLVRLYAVSGEGIDSHHRDHIQWMQKDDGDNIFSQIYKFAKLSDPLGTPNSEPKTVSVDKQYPDQPIAEGYKFQVMRGEVLANKAASTDEVSEFLDACSIMRGSQEWDAAFAGVPIQVDGTTVRFIRI